MFDIEEAIAQWRKAFRRNPAMEDGYVEELESHLRDLIEQGEGAGLSPEEAFDQAVLQIGAADEIGADFYKTDTRHLSGRPPWQTSRWLSLGCFT